MTLDRPSDALDVTTDAVSLAFAVVSAVVEACLKFCRRRRKRDCRISARVAGGADMAAGAQRHPTEELRAVGKVVTSASSLSGSIGDCRGFLAAALR